MKRHQEIPDFIKECPQIELPFAGARGWLVQGEGRQVVWIEFTETVDVPEHTHQEQWEFVLAGRVELKCEGCLKWSRPGTTSSLPRANRTRPGCMLVTLP